ncbi:PorT family protein [Mucilaginibacter hurinus]|uniref:PorT family protein n=1 Tax=Mucilaginibacter hurinus TaxID=2201324 RepID=A0A367GT58_9SPHI|nr:porin family protein [Mucilaginibacter hurinus]RCH56026.1 PorT family protein [Mucilaginibacter hurinus]
MKKITLLLAICLCTSYYASAQVPLLPKVQFGVKAGVNMSSFSLSNPSFDAKNRAGYLGGFWGRFSALGIMIQPELYLTGKNVQIKENDNVNRVNFTSIDVPVLFGAKVGALGLGGRFYTGPLVSFVINDDQNLGGAFVDAVTLSDIKKQAFAWTVGAGLDVRRLSVDLRYEAGLTKHAYNKNSSRTRINLFNLSLGYRFN